MSVFAGPFAIATATLALGGALKAFEPGDTAHAMRALGLPAGACSCASVGCSR